MANDFSKIAIQLQKHKTVQGIMKYVNQEALIELLDFIAEENNADKNRISLS